VPSAERRQFRAIRHIHINSLRRLIFRHGLIQRKGIAEALLALSVGLLNSIGIAGPSDRSVVVIKQAFIVVQHFPIVNIEFLRIGENIFRRCSQLLVFLCQFGIATFKFFILGLQFVAFSNTIYEGIDSALC
jgi:hypothetical protein